METNWQTIDTAPNDGEQFMAAHWGTWYPKCKICEGELLRYDDEEAWVPTRIDLNDPGLRWAPKPNMPGFPTLTATRYNKDAMTVAELIEILKKQDQNAVVHGYGPNCEYKEFNPLDTIKPVKDIKGVNRVMIYCD